MSLWLIVTFMFTFGALALVAYASTRCSWAGRRRCTASVPGVAEGWRAFEPAPRSGRGRAPRDGGSARSGMRTCGVPLAR